jgi:hypothetical protein
VIVKRLKGKPCPGIGSKRYRKEQEEEEEEEEDKKKKKKKKCRQMTCLSRQRGEAEV